jgi:hypothetical protein
VREGAVPAAAVKGLTTEEEFGRIPEALLIDEGDVAPGADPSHYAFARGSARMNLFRIYLE